jgi:two-component system phosphate regulon response regulator PhoB
VLDVLLPGLDGLEVCKVLRRNPTTAGIPIVMLTARSEDADVVAGLELGADDYLTKPFSPRVAAGTHQGCCVANSRGRCRDRGGL